MRIDLHTHSNASDGTDTPAELVAIAAQAGLDVVALTDHDTTGGWAAAEAALPPGMTLIRGAEFSTGLLMPGGHRVSVHLLAYLFDPLDAAVVAEHRRLFDERLQRGLRIVDLMVADGIPISREQVLAISAGAPVGRPHIGRALVASGVVTSVNEAFERYLAGNSGYYVPKVDTDLNVAVRMIAAAGGVSVMAHSRSRSAARFLTPERIAELAALGLDGIEVDHPDHAAADRVELAGLARELDLITTGSSDYHGTNKTIRIGAEHTAPDQLARIVDRATGIPVIGPAGARA
ncbi:PHP domain-containing protein [Nakamurella deserti]|uniref:PHP domain-containing protein n=1 Tax=Nakamurella deserti TaxID=2164074 RepID=UPI000DBE9137|nr:PHP domain-containing protein [Nakamurella deserti]